MKESKLNIKVIYALALVALVGCATSVPKLDPEAIKTDRAKALDVFLKQEYGVRPVERPADLRFETAADRVILGGKAVHRATKISANGPRGPFSFTANAYLPKGVKKAPVFVVIFLGQRIQKCKFVATAEDPSTEYMPVADIISRGYAAVMFNNWDVALDDKAKCFDTGVFKAWGPSETERTDESWAAISAWAWGASRVLDWAATQPDLDASKAAVIGHSRGGKTALLAGVTDTRFRLACVNDSGCSGAKLNHMDLPKSESIKRINSYFPHWFCKNYRQYADKEMEMDFDQHQLVALMAPRAVAIASATEDHWAGQPAEFESGRLASPAWEAYGLKGLVAPNGFPPPDTPLQEGNVSYHIRTGKHSLTPYDWKCYMDFADKLGFAGK